MPFRDELVIVIEVGSYEHRALQGLAESLGPPRLRVSSTVIYDSTADEYYCGEDAHDVAQNETRTLQSIDTIVGGEVRDWAALIALWSHILYSLAGGSQEEPGDRLSHHPVLLVVPEQWSRADRERATRIFFELFKVSAFMTLHASMAALFACNAVTGTVIDVGHDKTDIVAILESVPTSAVTLPFGGRQLTQELLECWQSSPPRLAGTLEPVDVGLASNFDVAEAVKRSHVAEMIPDKATSRDGMLDFQTAADGPQEDEGVLDIAAVVTKGNTKEYLSKLAAEKAQRAVQGQAEVPNAERETNTIKLAEGGPEIVVGPERLTLGTQFVAGPLSDAIYDCIDASVIDLARRRELWENVVLVGNGAKLRGFRDALQAALTARFSALYAQPAVEPGAYFYNVAAYPTMIRLLKIPLHFSEWQSREGARQASADKGTLEEATFLGGQVTARVAFGDSHMSQAQRHYISRTEYSEQGPAAIHT